MCGVLLYFLNHEIFFFEKLSLTVSLLYGQIQECIY